MLSKFIMALLVSSSLIGHAAVRCVESPEDAARSFVRAGVQGGENLGGLLRPKSLAALRGRLEQLLDDRYAPDAGAFRAELVGQQWVPATMRKLSNEEFVGKYFEAAQRRHPIGSVSDIQVVARKTSWDAAEEIVVSYTLTAKDANAREERKYLIYLVDGCWKVDAPIELWARLAFVAKTLKQSRDTPKSKEGPSRATLMIASASNLPRAGAVEMGRRSNAAAPERVWVNTDAVLTADDIAGASASWDCGSELGPEDVALQLSFTDEGAQKIRQWSQRNIGSQLAVVVNGQVASYARVAGVLGQRFSICLPGTSLEDGQALAGDLRGVKH